ncbi:L-seryl-tRNA(Sec) selenium transferase [Campylobacter sp. RM16192]|uniref:L-seryl-tRNA(Sec) selenium transferase n=1 Tax=Campylobacter sp. RM16192 TaxID=1660080 RepID=UPI001451CE54|nr:L-seryl-tRNA(Sec) selenium transferase [Campylobacter sp. RM16192]QCD51856.1 selenocysteine synthase [Campylobacter sp. RM16192]
MSEFKKLPQIDKILKCPEFKDKISSFVTEFARDEIEFQRAQISLGKPCAEFKKIIKNILKRYEKFQRSSLQKVINATGVIVHTNLGRSVIDQEILNRAKDIICSYSNLEYSLDKGARSNRYDYVGSLLANLFGFEDAIVVNNNASAVFLVLNTFAKNGEAIISRGELVEIGGGFRVPEVMLNSGAILKEIGTTNKTNIDDYEGAIGENSKMILKVHRSNFDIVGFSEEVDMSELSNLARKHEILDYYDLGSGYIGALPYGLEHGEISLASLAKNGVSLVSFSGDKLFGSVQCGIILGKKDLIEKLKKNQLLRMLRVDKVIISILSESVKAYINREFELITTLKHLYKSIDELKELANKINENLKSPLKVVDTKTFVGGGTMPNKAIPSVALALRGDANLNELKFREKNVIGRIENGEFLLDLRSVLDSDLKELIEVINEIGEANE